MAWRKLKREKDGLKGALITSQKLKVRWKRKSQEQAEAAANKGGRKLAEVVP